MGLGVCAWYAVVRNTLNKRCFFAALQKANCRAAHSSIRAEEDTWVESLRDPTDLPQILHRHPQNVYNMLATPSLFSRPLGASAVTCIFVVAYDSYQPKRVSLIKLMQRIVLSCQRHE